MAILVRLNSPHISDAPLRLAHTRGLVPADSPLKSLHEETGCKDQSHELFTRSVLRSESLTPKLQTSLNQPCVAVFLSSQQEKVRAKGKSRERMWREQKEVSPCPRATAACLKENGKDCYTGQFKFVGLVTGTKSQSPRLDFMAKKDSSHDGTCPRDLLQGLVDP